MEELAGHREELDPKYHFLADAPRSDDKGNRTVVRYSRKHKHYYLSTQKDGKSTGWTAQYEDGEWVVSLRKKEDDRTHPKKGKT